MMTQSTHTTLKGFSLIELIGVMSIISILAASTVPNMIKRIDSAHADAETTTLMSLATGLEQYITQNFVIPDESLWAMAIAEETISTASQITTNAKGFKRGYYVDPNFFQTADITFATYHQDLGLTKPPVRPRIMIVSNLSANAPPAPTSGIVFDNIWNQTASATIVESPTIKIQRVYLGASFQQLVLLNSTTQTPAYQVNQKRIEIIPAAAPPSITKVTLYVLKHTLLSLYETPNLSTPVMNLQYQIIVSQPSSFIYATNGSSNSWSRP